MSKKLNITAITNDLEGSAFFPAKKTPSPSPTQRPTMELKTAEELRQSDIMTPAIEHKLQIPERPNARIGQRPNGKRIITRNSFEIYEDQMDVLRKLAYHEKMEGKLGSMSGMVRKAIDQYLQKITPDK